MENTNIVFRGNGHASSRPHALTMANIKLALAITIKYYISYIYTIHQYFITVKPGKNNLNNSYFI